MTGEVPTTPTALDRQEEVRKLNIDIATLKSLKEVEDRHVKELQASVFLLSSKEDGLVAEVGDLEGLLLKTIQSAKSTVILCTEAIRSALGDVENAKTVLGVLLSKVDEADRKAKDALEAQERVHNEIVRETEELEKKKGDLRIYHKRLQEYFAIHLPDQQVVL